MSSTKPIDWAKPIRTVDGRPARVICTDRKSNWSPIIVLVSIEPDGEVVQFTNEEALDFAGAACFENIPPEPVITVRFRNVYTKSAVTYALHPELSTAILASLENYGPICVLREELHDGVLKDVSVAHVYPQG